MQTSELVKMPLSNDTVPDFIPPNHPPFVITDDEVPDEKNEVPSVPYSTEIYLEFALGYLQEICNDNTITSTNDAETHLKVDYFQDIFHLSWTLYKNYAESNPMFKPLADYFEANGDGLPNNSSDKSGELVAQLITVCPKSKKEVPSGIYLSYNTPSIKNYYDHFGMFYKVYANFCFENKAAYSSVFGYSSYEVQCVWNNVPFKLAPAYFSTYKFDTPLNSIFMKFKGWIYAFVNGINNISNIFNNMTKMDGKPSLRGSA